MATRSVHIAGLIGASDVVVPPARLTVEVAPAYKFVNGSAVNWPAPVEYELVGGEVTVDGMEDTYLGEDLVWAFTVLRRDARGNAKVLERVTKTFPAGAGMVEYSDMLEVGAPADPEYGPTYLTQALIARNEAEAFAADAQAATSSKIDIATKQAIGGVPAIDSSGIVRGVDGILIPDIERVKQQVDYIATYVSASERLPGIDPSIALPDRTAVTDSQPYFQAVVDKYAAEYEDVAGRWFHVPGRRIQIEPGVYKFLAEVVIPAKLRLVIDAYGCTFARDGLSNTADVFTIEGAYETYSVLSSTGTTVTTDQIRARAVDVETVTLDNTTVTQTRVWLEERTTVTTWVQNHIMKIISDDDIPGGRRDDSWNIDGVQQRTPKCGEFMIFQGSSNSRQLVTVTGNPTGGTFTLTFQGQTTTALAYNADGATVQSALETLSTVGAGNVQVTKILNSYGVGTTSVVTRDSWSYKVTWLNALAIENQSMLTGTASLTGGTTGTGNSEGTRIRIGNTAVLHNQPFNTYTTNIRLAHILEGTVTLSGATLTVSNANWSARVKAQSAIRVISAIGPKLIDVTVNRAVGPAIVMEDCYGYDIERLRVKFAVNDESDAIFGYAIQDVGSTGGRITGGDMWRCRHGYSDKSTDAALNDSQTKRYGQTFHPYVNMMVRASSGAPLDTHSESVGVHFDHCVVYAAATETGIGFRGRDGLVTECDVYGGNAGLRVFTESNGGDTWSRGHVVRGLRVTNVYQPILVEVRVDASAGTNAHPSKGVQDTETNLTVEGLVARNVTRFGNFVNARVHLRNIRVEFAPSVTRVLAQQSNSYVELDGAELDLSRYTTMLNSINGSSTDGRIWRCGVGSDDAQFTSRSEDQIFTNVRVRTNSAARSAFVAAASGDSPVGPFSFDSASNFEWRDVEFDAAFSTGFGSFTPSDTKRQTMHWNVRALTGSSLTDKASSSWVSLGATDLADGNKLKQLLLGRDPNLMLRAVITSSSATLAALGRGRAAGQTLTIIIQSTPSGGSALTINNGGNVSLAGGSAKVLDAENEFVQLTWTGTTWMQTGTNL